jgi:hypothetical protein
MSESSRTKTVKWLKDISNDELEMFFVGNLPMTPEEKRDQKNETFEEFCINMGTRLCIEFDIPLYEIDFDYRLLWNVEKELNRKTPKQRIERYLGVANDNGWQVRHRNWKRAVHERDGYKCQMCGANTSLHAHHIKSRAEYPDIQFDVSNGTTLCNKCHKSVHLLEYR